jgi:hypothetical protein
MDTIDTINTIDTMRACSIDVGKVNLGVYVEEFTELDSGKALYLKRVDLTEKKSERVTVDFLKRLFAYLGTIKELLSGCDYLIVEKQLRANPEAQFVDHALQSYFILQCPTSKVISFSSKNKTRLFDESKMTKYQRKKWATVKALEMMEARNETEIVAYIKSLKKKDDVSDAICQLDAWKAIHYTGKQETIRKTRAKKAAVAAEGAVDAPVVKKPRAKKTAVAVDGSEPVVKKSRAKKTAVAVDGSAPVVKKPRAKKTAVAVDGSEPVVKKSRAKKTAVAVDGSEPVVKKSRTKKTVAAEDAVDAPVVKKPRTKKTEVVEDSVDAPVVKKPRAKKNVQTLESNAVEEVKKPRAKKSKNTEIKVKEFSDERVPE